MISQETKDAIEKEARECALYGFPSSQSTHFDRRIHSYITGAINYAEKLEEKDKIIESKDIELTVWKDTADKFKRLVEEKDKEIEQLRIDLSFQKEQFGIAERNFDRCMADLIKEWCPEKKDTKLEIIKSKIALETELAQLKEIAKKMAGALKFYALADTSVTRKDLAEALTAYAEWCK